MENKLKKISEDAQKRGYDVRIRDVAYALLRVYFNDASIAYNVVFGAPQNNDVATYDLSDNAQYLIGVFEKEFAPKDVENDLSEDIIKSLKKEETDDSGSMTFEENRAGIESQIQEILDLKKELIGNDGKCTDVKTMATLQKTEADLRSKLNDKFGASEKSKEQYVIVQKKFDIICPHTRRECYQMTKEDAMKIWSLIEKE